MAQIVYTKRQLIERIFKHLNNGFPNADWKISTNECLLYIDSAIPFVLKGIVFDNAKITNVIDIPEAFLLTYQYNISNQDNNTREWYVTLIQPPLALPTGYDITQVYIADPKNGKSQNAYPIKVKRVPYRDYMPKPSGFSYRISNGQTMFLKMSDGGSLYGYSLYVEQPMSRTQDIDDPMYLPDDAIDLLFTKTVQTILQRYQVPQDIVQDNLAAGNKTS